MFNDLPKLFERNFVMSFFFPMAILVGISAYILETFNLSSMFTSISSITVLEITLVGLTSWLGAILLLVGNRDVYRLLEGYGPLNPLKIVGFIQKRKFLRLKRQLEALDDEYREKGNSFPVTKQHRRMNLMRELANHFPDKEEWLLPTAFGNTIRSFEIYPRIMYGLEGVQGWSRILAFVPDSYRELIDNSKAQVDFWVNLGVISTILIIESITFSIWFSSIDLWWLAIGGFGVAFFASYRAKRVALQWGEFVKTAFDIYRFDLLETLRIESPRDRNEERVIWQKFSQSILYNLPDELPELKRNKREAD